MEGAVIKVVMGMNAVSCLLGALAGNTFQETWGYAFTVFLCARILNLLGEDG